MHRRGNASIVTFSSKETSAHPRAARKGPQNYRPDIDGLRAIAVVAVVAYHAFPTSIRGGFIGVDIFFVISGFLISRVLFKELQEGSFGLNGFYARRIKRIFPALCLVLASCWIAGWFILTPGEYRNLGKEILAGSTFASNFYFWQQTGYFDGGADTKPLLHLWSLAIEEQFYLLWPLFLWSMWRFKARLTVLLPLLCAASFAFNVALVNHHQAAAFYSPLSRFWELMTGGMLAHLSLSKQFALHLSRHKNACSMLGALLVLAGLVLTNEQSAFPGWYAVFPVAGAFLLISSTDAWLNRRVLGSAPLRAIGLISYPLYLWHWPVLYLVRYFDLWRSAGEHGARWIAIGVCVILSCLTYAAIEKPVRFGFLRKRSTVPLSAFMTAMIGLGTLTILSGGFAGRDQGEMSRLARFAGKYPASEWRDRTCFLSPADGEERFVPDCAGSNKPGPLVFLWGDSYAAALYPGLKALEENGNFRLAQYTASACPPLLGSSFPAQPHCTEINKAVLQRIARTQPQTVVLTARWSYRQVEPGYDFKYLSNTVAEVRKAGIRHIVVVGPAPQWEKSMPSLLPQCADRQTIQAGNWFSSCGLSQGTDGLDSSLRVFSTQLGVSYVSAYSELCNAAGCLTVLDSGAVSTYDLGHLSPEASRLLVGKVAGQILSAETARE